jgi:hypothetical protein
MMFNVCRTRETLRKKMKNVCIVVTLLLPVIVSLSCASKPAARQPSPVTEQAPAREAAPPPSPEEEVYAKYSGDIILDGAKSYRVVWTDTLSKIARRQYGSRNGYYFPLIMLASGDRVRDPDLIIGGTVLTVPDLRRNLNDPGARRRIKDLLNEIAGVYSSRRTRWSAQTGTRLRALASSL